MNELAVTITNWTNRIRRSQKNSAEKIQVASLASTAPAIAIGAAQMKWIRIHNRTAMPLWTSDHPVTLYNPKPASLMGNLGWACPGVQVSDRSRLSSATRDAATASE